MLFKEKDKVINFRLDSYSYMKLTEFADKMDIPISCAIRKALTMFISVVESNSSYNSTNSIN